MMTDMVMSRAKLKEMLQGMLKEYRLVAPVRENGNLLFKEVDNVDDIVINDEVTYRSPKEFLFPQVERIMGFDSQGGTLVEGNPEKTVIFGVRPCDLEAIKILTAVFTQGKYVDTYFLNHLSNTTLIGLGCVNEKPGCFCQQRGIDKDYSMACDVFIQTSGDDYKIVYIKDSAKQLFKDNIELPEDSCAKAGATTDKTQIIELDSDENTLFNEIDWAKHSEKCLACGTCTYICPTCHCFEFKDTKQRGEAYRYRCWDSCMYPKFTLHASGHNPRPSKTERFRQRVMHKYLYVKQNFGYTACTGCGRCIRSCPAGMNIKSIVSEIMEELK